jgi:hypothetical protein
MSSSGDVPISHLHLNGAATAGGGSRSHDKGGGGGRGTVADAEGDRGGSDAIGASAQTAAGAKRKAGALVVGTGDRRSGVGAGASSNAGPGRNARRKIGKSGFRRVLYTCPHTTPLARWTPIIKDFCRRISPPRVPRFQSRHTSTPFNSASDAFELHPDVASYGTTLIRGVAFHGVSKKFRARITSNTGDGRQRALGYYETAELAARAYDVAARELGVSADLLNFPTDAETAEGVGSGGADASAPPPADPPPPRKGAGAGRPTKREGVASLELAIVGPNGESEAALVAVKEGKATATGIKGVRLKGKGSYEARIKVRGNDKRMQLGRFPDARSAMRAYDAAARRAGYCVNRVEATGDLIDTQSLAAIGVACDVLKGVKELTHEEAAKLAIGELPAVPGGVEVVATNSAAIAGGAGGGKKYATFVRVKPGIHEYLGTFDTLEESAKKLKASRPSIRGLGKEWAKIAGGAAGAKEKGGGKGTGTGGGGDDASGGGGSKKPGKKRTLGAKHGIIAEDDGVGDADHRARLVAAEEAGRFGLGGYVAAVADADLGTPRHA